MSQTERLLVLLRARPEGITAIEALEEVGSFRLAARIADLRADGFDIEAEPWLTPTGKRVARYRLHETAQLGFAL